MKINEGYDDNISNIRFRNYVRIPNTKIKYTLQDFEYRYI